MCVYAPGSAKKAQQFPQLSIKLNGQCTGKALHACNGVYVLVHI